MSPVGYPLNRAVQEIYPPRQSLTPQDIQTRCFGLVRCCLNIESFCYTSGLSHTVNMTGIFWGLIEIQHRIVELSRYCEVDPIVIQDVPLVMGYPRVRDVDLLHPMKSLTHSAQQLQVKQYHNLPYGECLVSVVQRYNVMTNTVKHYENS